MTAQSPNTYKDTIRKYSTLKQNLRNYLPADDLIGLENAFNKLAKISETNEQIIAKINDSLDIALIIAEMLELDLPSIIAALYFPVFDGNLIDAQELHELFGGTTVKIILGLKHLANIDTSSISTRFEKTETTDKKGVRERNKAVGLHTENFRKLLMSLAGDVRSVLIRLAHRLFVMRNLYKYPVEKQKEIARETSRSHAPIAHRLGLYKLKTELEELSMKYNESDMYNQIQQKLKQSETAREDFIKRFISPIKSGLDKLSLPYTIKGRPKSVFSIWKKMKRQGVGFEGVYDLFAIRVILTKDYESTKEEKNDCWRVYSTITDMYSPNENRLRDWISSPKASGYESLHTTVKSKDERWIEVQIRTTRMDEVAEKGMAAHWKYKGGKSQGAEESWLARIREILENPDTKSLETLDKSKIELYSDELFVFTPQGELRKTKPGSSILDFAFDIHSQLGEQCVGAIVNGKKESYKYKIRNGDVVEVQTSKNQKPRLEWLEFCITSKAKSRIKRFVKGEDHKLSDLGKEALQRKMAQLKLDLNNKAINKLMEHYKVSSHIELFSGYGEERFDLSKVRRIIEGKPEQVKNQATPVKQFDEEQYKKELQNADFLLIGRLDTLDYTMAKCCNPVFGDKVFGFVTVSKGTKIHKVTCPNAKDLRTRYPYRVIRARWNEMKEGTAFLASLKVSGQDRQGIVSQISKVVTTDLGLDMTSINIESKKQGTFDGSLRVKVNNKEHLEHVISKLRKIGGIHDVFRV